MTIRSADEERRLSDAVIAQPPDQLGKRLTRHRTPVFIEHNSARTVIRPLQQTLTLIIAALVHITGFTLGEFDFGQRPETDLTPRSIEALAIARSKVGFPAAALEPANRQQFDAHGNPRAA